MIELHSNIGEVKVYEFYSVKEAIDFLNKDELIQVFITSDSVTLFDIPPKSDDDDDNGQML